MIVESNDIRLPLVNKTVQTKEICVISDMSKKHDLTQQFN